MTYEQHLAWLITMAQSTAWKDYAWQRAKELDADKSGLWTGIASDLKREMLALKSAQEVPNRGG
jgi:hypothetical protein